MKTLRVGNTLIAKLQKHTNRISQEELDPIAFECMTWINKTEFLMLVGLETMKMLEHFFIDTPFTYIEINSNEDKLYENLRFKSFNYMNLKFRIGYHHGLEHPITSKPKDYRIIPKDYEISDSERVILVTPIG